MENFPFSSGITLRTILLLLIFSAAVPSFSQSVIWADTSYTQTRGKTPQMVEVRATEPDTIKVTITEPFVDDFSYASSLPDSNRWFIQDIDFRVPRVVRNSALTPPTVGTVRFDGLRRNGIPYETFLLTTGPTDRLVSHFLDLSGLRPSDNIRLYLYVESGGRCDAPESTDSFRVNLITPSDTFVLASLGGDIAGGRTWVSVDLDSADYFSPLAQLVFESNGSQNGLLDVWQVDYIYLGQEWPGGIVNLDDQSPTRLLSSPLEPYFAFPFKLYTRDTGWQSDHAIEIRQNALPAFNGTLHSDFLSLTASPSGQFFSDITFSVPGAGAQSVQIPAVSDQQPTQPGPWSSTHYLKNHSDRLAANDTLVTTILMDSTMGYDDGIPDKVFGLTKALSFGLRFDLPDKDTVDAVWMHFSPLVYTNGVNGKITYLEDKVFRLRMWSHPHPDSFFVEQVVNMKVIYGEEGTYFRLPLSTETEVPKTFWVGLQQLDEIPIGLGLDASYDRDPFSYRDSAGNWVNTNIDGAPMIRLEVRTGYKPQVSSVERWANEIAQSPKLESNPVRRGETIRILTSPGVTQYSGALLDLQGRSIFEVNYSRPTESISDALPSELSEGMYLWRHVWKFNGQTFIHTERLLIQP